MQKIMKKKKQFDFLKVIYGKRVENKNQVLDLNISKYRVKSN
jgi:hypothetical protein